MKLGIRRIRRWGVAALAAATATAGLLPLVAATPASAAPTTSTLAGATRYETSAAVAKAKFPNGVSSGNVVLATGENFPDALAGNYLAGQLGSPILLTTPHTSDNRYGATVVPTLAALLPGATKNVTILGGTNAVGADVQTISPPRATL